MSDFCVHIDLIFPVSNEVPEQPVISPVSGCVYERRLIEKYVSENGTDPMNGEKLEPQMLVEIKSTLIFIMLAIQDDNQMDGYRQQKVHLIRVLLSYCTVIIDIHLHKCHYKSIFSIATGEAETSHRNKYPGHFKVTARWVGCGHVTQLYYASTATNCATKSYLMHFTSTMPPAV